MINALSIDLEYWWCNEFLTNHLPEKKDDLIYESVSPLINLLDKYNTRATFFVLGIVAGEHPDLIEYIYEKGHEIACHAYSHRTLYDLGKEDFENEILKSKGLLSKYGPIGFRAPSFSLDNRTKWALEILEKYGFQYDSSIFPIKTMLYGVPKASCHIYRPKYDDVAQHDPNGSIIEFPLTTVKLGNINIPISGGFYLRTLPIWFLKNGIKRVNKDRPAIIYIHPWETYSNTPRMNVSLFSKFVAYHGISSSLEKLESLLSDFKFKPIRDVLNEI